MYNHRYFRLRTQSIYGMHTEHGPMHAYRLRQEVPSSSNLLLARCPLDLSFYHSDRSGVESPIYLCMCVWTWVWRGLVMWVRGRGSVASISITFQQHVTKIKASHARASVRRAHAHCKKVTT